MTGTELGISLSECKTYAVPVKLYGPLLTHMGTMSDFRKGGWVGFIATVEETFLNIVQLYLGDGGG